MMAASTEDSEGTCERNDSPQLSHSDLFGNKIECMIFVAATSSQLEVNLNLYSTESSTGFTAPKSCDNQTKSTNNQLVKALHAVLEDESFKFQSKNAMEAREAAVLMLEWATRQENLPVQLKFLQ